MSTDPTEEQYNSASDEDFDVEAFESGEEEDAEMEEGVEMEEGAEMEMEMDGEPAMNPDIFAVMAEEGPIVSCVLLKGGKTEEAEEIVVDLTPAKNQASVVLGGSVTLIGQYEEIQAVAMTTCEQPGDRPAWKLPSPLEGENVSGDVLLVRMDDDAYPQNLTVGEWTSFVSTRQ